MSRFLYFHNCVSQFQYFISVLACSITMFTSASWNSRWKFFVKMSEFITKPLIHGLMILDYPREGGKSSQEVSR